jgi:hypothetical protein
VFYLLLLNSLNNVAILNNNKHFGAVALIFCGNSSGKDPGGLPAFWRIPGA